MAWHEITEPNDTKMSFAADEDSDVTAIESAYDNIPVGSIVIADNAGSPKVYFMFPAGSFSPLN